MLIEASEANGHTSVQFARNAMTGDTNRDVQLAVSLLSSKQRLHFDSTFALASAIKDGIYDAL